MTEEEVRYICRLYRIPKFVDASLIGIGEDPAQPSNNAVTISKRFLKCGLNILFPSFFQEIISKISLAPSQLSPTAWLALSRCFAL